LQQPLQGCLRQARFQSSVRLHSAPCVLPGAVGETCVATPAIPSRQMGVFTLGPFLFGRLACGRPKSVTPQSPWHPIWFMGMKGIAHCLFLVAPKSILKWCDARHSEHCGERSSFDYLSRRSSYLCL
jgi:hypothetical protein